MIEIIKEKTCCFFGHRTIPDTPELRERVAVAVREQIEKGKDTFLFGSRSEFDALCLETVTELKKEYPHIRRIYVRAEYPDIDEKYTSYLLESYDDTYYPESIIGAGRAVYVKRNREMADRSSSCIVYCNAEGTAAVKKSGTAMACEYARKKGLEVVEA